MARAFTLVELLVVLAILAAGAVLALPAMRTFIERAELRAASGDLFDAIRSARSLAVARNQTVVLRAHDSAGWQAGWTVESGDAVLSRHGPLARGLQIESRMSISTGTPYIAYNGAGRPCTLGNAQAARFGHLRIAHGGHERRIIINMLGRPRLCDPARADSHCGEG